MYNLGILNCSFYSNLFPNSNRPDLTASLTAACSTTVLATKSMGAWGGQCAGDSGTARCSQ